MVCSSAISARASTSASFEFATSTRIVFKRGAASEVAKYVMTIGKQHSQRRKQQKMHMKKEQAEGEGDGHAHAHAHGEGDEEKMKVVVVTGSRGLDRPSLTCAKQSLEAMKEKIEYKVFRLNAANTDSASPPMHSGETTMNANDTDKKHSGDGQGHEPTVAMAAEAVEFAKTEGAELIIGIGGGSAIDMGKVCI